MSGVFESFGRSHAAERYGVDADPREFAADQLRLTLEYAREREYTGWDLYDGESSRVLRSIPVENKWLNLVFQQAVRRSPVNLRPLLLVEQRRSFLGAGLFALSNFAAHDLTGEDRYRAEALDLVDWLVANRSTGYSGFCGGHKHPLQGLDHRVPPNEPGVVGTSYAVRALLAAGERADDRYRETAVTAAPFVVEDLEYSETETGARIRYKPEDTGESYTLNANALGARLLTDLCAATDGPDPSYRDRATAILEYVASEQRERGGWPYRDPPEASHLSMDSFHNGFVLESFLRYREVFDSDRFDGVIDRGLEFYRTLFDLDGAPHWDESSVYPRDVHAAAQGIIVFAMCDEHDAADRTLRWTVERLSNGEGRFYHQRRRLYTDRTTLMRWCEAWMAYALATYLRRATELPTSHLAPSERTGRHPVDPGRSSQ